MHRAELFKGRDGDWYYRIVAGNNRVVAQSEGYSLRFSARRAVRRNHPDVERVDVLL